MNFKDDLLKYVSNLDKDVYTVSNLPEEVIAVIFAFVSRSPKSFRENIAEVTEEKAKDFHEKWVLNFGHSSVAELATIHICIENVSRLFSSILERANIFISPIEYSQRYQKPKKGNFYIPPELNEYPKLKEKYINFNNDAYDSYEKLNNKLLEQHLIANNVNSNNKNYKVYEKIAFEDARYVLPLSVYTNLGFTANGRALENLIMKLLSNKYSEVKNKGLEIKEEGRKILPSLLKYANENEYTKSFYEDKICDFYFDNIFSQNKIIRLMHANKSNEKDALVTILSPIITIQTNSSQITVENNLYNFSTDTLIDIFNKTMLKFDYHNELWDFFKEINYSFELYLSEASWHQFLRHRQINFYESDPNINNGITIPPYVTEYGCEDILYDVIDKSTKLYNIFNKELHRNHKHLSSYVVTNAHNRRVTASFNLWELYNVMKLRLSPHSQWDIKNIVHNIVNEIKKIHPNLIKSFLNILDY